MRPFRSGLLRVVRTRRRVTSVTLETLESRQLLAFDPSGIEQEMLELVNRFRAAPQSELSHLVSSINPLHSDDPDIDGALTFFQVDGPLLASQFTSLQPAQPLAWNEALSSAALFHNGVMIAQDAQEHELPGEPTLPQRLQNAGYTGYSTYGENIFAYAESALHGHAGFVIDWGNGPGGIQTPPGHRINLLNNNFREVGIAITPENNPNTQVGPLVMTQDFGNRFALGNPYLLGVAFGDANANGFYQAGEGAGGILVKAVGPAGTFQTTTMTAGGYQMQVPAGSYQVTFSGGPLTDPRTFSVVVAGAANSKLDINTSQTVFKLTQASKTVNESDGSVTIPVARTGGGVGTASVRITTSGGTATPGGDYTTIDQVLTWADGDTSIKNVVIPLVADGSNGESSETFNVTLSNSTGGALIGSPNQMDVTILETGSLNGLLQFSAPTYDVNETGGSATVSVTRVGGSVGIVSAQFATSNGTATAGSDYTTTIQTLTWTDGDTTARTITIPILNDATFDPNETVNLALTNLTGGAVLGAPGTAVLTILDTAVGTLQLGAATFSIGENGGSLLIPVLRVGGSSGEVSVTVTTSDGSATAGGDYTAVSQTLVWADGDVGIKGITIPILNDTANESDEAFNLALSNPTGGAPLGTPSTAVVTIVDNDPIGSLQLGAATFSIGESGGSLLVPVTRTGGSAGEVSVTITTSDGTATAGGDYTTVSQTVVWADGDTDPKTVTIPVLNDTAPESDETLNLALSNPTGGAVLGALSAAVVTIVDNDAIGTLQFGAATFVIDENGGSVAVPVTRTGGSAGAVSVRISTSNGTATAGSDYTALDQVLSWTDGDTAVKTVLIPIQEDTSDEPNETINLALTDTTGGAGLGTPNTAVVTIVDNDAPAVIPGSLQLSASVYTVNDTDGKVTITVTRTGGSDGAVSVQLRTSDGTAVAGSDYAAVVGTLTWANGETGPKTIDIPILNDGAADGDETVNLALSNPTGGAVLGAIGSATLTIVDVPSVLQFSAPRFDVNEANVSASLTITRTGDASALATIRIVTGGTAIAGVHFTPLPDTVSFGPGQTSLTLPVTILDNLLPGGDVRLDLTLTALSNDTILGSIPTASLVIHETDPALVIVTNVSARTVKVKRTQTTAIVVQFSGALNSASAQFRGNFSVGTVGKPRKKNAPPPIKPLGLSSIRYDPTARTVTLTLAKKLATTSPAQLKVLGTGLTDAQGRQIDGNRDGKPGGDVTATINRGRVSIAQSFKP